MTPWPAWSAAAMATALLGVGVMVQRHVGGWLPLDAPGPGRKQHGHPIPLAGALLAPPLVLWMLWDPFWPGDRLGAVAVALAALIGWLDDRRKAHGDGLDWRSKALGLAVVAGLAAASTCDPTHAPGRWLALAGFAFVFVNALNFLDNQNGVAAAMAAATLVAAGGGGIGAFARNDWTAAAAATALAFLPWNWPRARLFLGDAGAYALGTAAAIAVCAGLHHGPSALWLAAVPLADFAQVVAVRLWLGLPPWVGDRRHLTHRALGVGVPAWALAPAFAAAAWALAQLA
jgi:UDP-N-acetylmuramyl pentapeptide phosphotransferase/UDP-N-acetylglucosamine-1-phosphate transferase